MTPESVERLCQAAAGVDSLLILTHNNPDPDAVASAVALRELLLQLLRVDSPIAYHGVIGRAENQALVRYLRHPLKPLTDALLDDAGALALVDVQAGAGNLTIPPRSSVALVIDHHARQPGSAAAAFSDVRPELGATSTILLEYLREAAIDLPPRLATALFYGIKTNTMGLGRNTSPADVAAYRHLRPLVDGRALARIEQAQVPPEYFRSFYTALRMARVYAGVVISDLGPLSYPDLTAEMADVLLRLQRAQWVLCMGDHKGTLYLSVRARDPDAGAEPLAQFLVAGEGSAGGQRALAGGQIPLAGRDAADVAQQVRLRLLQHLGVPPDQSGEPLI
jgi:nanoRNase/pAp phosphatase (c-di-AMP/oligoRNAs hydrolase)